MAHRVTAILQSLPNQIARRRLPTLRHISLLLLASFVITTPGFAQQESAPPEIVVQGKRETYRKQVKRFVRQVSSRNRGQLIRYADPICPIVVGLSVTSNKVIIDRIRSIALQVDVKQSKVRCDPNLFVIFAHDSDNFFVSARRRFPRMFKDLTTSELKRAVESGPVHVWSTVEVQNEDGQSISGANDEGVKILSISRASRILEATQQVVLRSVIVIDAKAAIGKSLTQVADYAAMRTLAGAHPPQEINQIDTILRLFDDIESAPPELTSVDRGYLVGLYRTHPNGRAINEFHTIEKEIRR